MYCQCVVVVLGAIQDRDILDISNNYLSTKIIP